MKKDLNKTTHYLTNEELARNLFYPKDNKEKFPALPSELNANGQINFSDPEAIKSYVDRAVDTDNTLKNVLIDYEDKAIAIPSYTEMLGTNIGNIGNILNAAKVTAQIYTTESIKGTTADELPYVSQEEYKKRKAEGEAVSDIFPQLTEDSARTYTDWLFWALKKPTDIKFDDPNRILPNATERLRMREQWYDEGGEVGPDGKWYNIEEKTLPSGNKQTIKTPSNFNRFWTPLEYKTEEQYEKRKNENLTWNNGIYNAIRQKFAYEFMDGKNDAALDALLSDRLNQHINNPKYAELQEWSKSVEWSEAFDEGQLTKKVVNAITGALPSYLIQMGTAVGVGALTKSPSAALTTQALIGASMDSSDMFIDAYDYLIEKGFSDVEAKNLAMSYFENYFAASMALERLPFMFAFRRTTKDPVTRRGLIKKFFGDKFKNNVDELSNTKLYGGLTVDDFNRVAGATFTQGVAESVTEIAQYTTQMAMQTGQPINQMYGFNLPIEFETGGYREEQKFDDLADINTLLDAAVGGFGMGAITGAVTPQTRTEQIKPKAPPGSQIGQTPPVQPTQKSTKAQATTKPITQQGAESASPTTRNMSTYNEVEYLEDVVNIQMGAQPDLLGEQRASEMIASGRTDKFANKVISHQKRKFEQVPLQKVVDLVNDYGLNIIDKTNLDKDVKDSLKLEVLEEIKRKKGSNLRNKKDITKDEKQKLNRIDNLTVDNLIDAAQKNISVDKLVSVGVDKALQTQQEQAIADVTQADVDPMQQMSDEAIDKAIQEQLNIPADLKKQREESKKLTDKEADKAIQSQTKVPAGLKRTEAPVISKDKTPVDNIVRRIGEQESILRTYENKLKQAPANKKPAIQKDIDEVKARIQTLNNKLPDEAKGISLNEETALANQAQSTAKEANLIDSPNFYVESEKSIVSKLTNKRLDKIIKEKKEKRDKESEGLAVKEKMQLAAEIQSLESEKERRQEAKDKKKVKDVEVKPKEAITLEEADNEIFAQFLQDNDIDNVRDIGGKSKTKSGLTKEQQQDLETEVEQTKEELNKKNCQ